MISKRSVLRSVLPKSVVLSALAAGIAVSMGGSNALACAPDSDLLGSICAVPYRMGCPYGYLPADGRQMPIQQNAALYSLLGVTFGGDGVNNFNLPDLRGRVIVGTGQATSVSGRNPTSTVQLGQYRGQETVTLTQGQLPPHTHAAQFSPTSGPVPINLPAQPGSGAINASATTDILPGNTGSTKPAVGTSYYLTGVGGTTAGPVTTTAPTSGNKATLIGTNVAVDTSTYKPAIPAQSTSVTAVTGGTVAITPTPNQTATVPTLPPELGVTYCISIQGLYPSFP